MSKQRNLGLGKIKFYFYVYWFICCFGLTVAIFLCESFYGRRMNEKCETEVREAEQSEKSTILKFNSLKVQSLNYIYYE